MGKLLVIASVVISLASAGLGFVNKGALTKTKEDLANSEAAKTAADQKSATAEKNLKTKEAELASAQAAQAAAETAATAAKADAAKAQGDLTALNNKVTEADTTIASLNAQIKELNDKIAAAPVGGTQTTQADNTEYVTRIQELETLTAKLQSELDSAKGITKTLQQREDDRQKKQLAKGTEGRVLAVNPAWNFVVLSLGDKQGISNNTELLVKRGTRFLGKVRITSVEPSTSIADIVANSMPQGTTIAPGDNVIFQGNDEE
jgi:hypothetical protein